MLMSDEKQKKLRRDTLLVRGALNRSEAGESTEAIFATSAFVYDSPESAEARFSGTEEGFIYTRYGNPTVQAFERRLALLDGAAQARATASGMSAVSASLMCWLSAGDHVVASRALFGSCRYVIEWVLPRFGIESTLVDGRDLDAWRGAVQKNTVAFFLESPSNPGLELVDIAGLRALADDAKHNGTSRHGIKLIVDNVFATALLQKPLELGADVVVYSATKHIDGQGRVLGGAVLCDDDFANDYLEPWMRHTGPNLSPFNAWLLLKSIETLSVRIERQCDSAEAIAQKLQSTPGVERVVYPGLTDHPQRSLAAKQMRRGGTLVTFDVSGGKEGAFEFMRKLEIIDLSNNLGDTRTIATHPATTTHAKFPEEMQREVGIRPGTIRLSLGLEDRDDLLDDISAALS